MNVALSPSLQEAHTGLLRDLKEIELIARRLDRDIRVRGLRVEGRRSRNPVKYSGWAFPEIRTRRRQQVVHHPDGRVVLNIGDECSEEDIIRLYAHELRHMGQFHRGRRTYGVMTTHPLDMHESEDDAYAFEDRVLERMP